MNMEATPPERVTFLRRTTDCNHVHSNINNPYTLSYRTPYTGLLPNWLPPGPVTYQTGNPGVVSHQTGDYRTTDLPPRRAVYASRALPECQYYHNWAPTDTPRLPDRSHYRPAGYSRTTLSVHEFTIT